MTHYESEIRYAEEQAAFFEKLALNPINAAAQKRHIKSVEFYRKHAKMLRELEAKERRKK